MANGQLGTVMQYIRRLVVAKTTRDLTDRELLHRYCALRDEGAFAALVQRHAQLVWGVCRQVLHHEQDAEDAWQASILVLARYAPTIRKAEALASWLHGVAYRTAMMAKREAAIRRAHERRERNMPHQKPDADVTWRELQAVLAEEVQRLPEKYRAPFVLCCLEGKSKPEAAQELGWKEGTVSGRLAQARKQLQQRLARRGMALSAVLCAAALTRSAVGAALVNPTIRAALLFAADKTAAAGIVSGQVAALAEGVTQAMFATKVKIATVFILALGLAVAGASVATHRQAAALAAADAKQKPEATRQKPEADAKKPPANNDKDAITVRGRVLDPEGKPVSGAKLYVSSLRLEIEQYKHEERAESGADGRFRLTLSREELAQDFFPLVFATAKGYGPDWVALDKKNSEGELSLRLVRDDVPIRGRIIDVEGRPVSGAKLRVQFTKAFREQDGLDKYLEYRRAGGYEQAGGGETVWGPLPGQPTEITTDRAGRFTLSGVGRERVVRFAIEGPAIQHWAFVAMTRAADTARALARHNYGPVYGANFDYVAAASVPIRGKVRDKATGKPVAGVRIRAGAGHGGFTTHTTRTDKDGAYELLGYPRSETYHLLAQPAEGQAYFAENVDRPDTAGSDSITADIDLISGTPLRGQVTDAATKKPVKGAKVYYYPLRGNRYDARMSTPGESSTTTGADGSFGLPVLPGPGVVALECSGKHPYMSPLVTVAELRDFFNDKGAHDDSHDSEEAELAAAGGRLWQFRYQALALINPDEKADSLKHDLTVQPGRTLTGTILGTDGKPLAGATTNALMHIRVVGTGPVPQPTASFTLSNLNPRRTIPVEFRHEEKGLGLFKTIRCDAAEPLTVQLQPCGSVIGRILDKDGKPIPDFRMQLFHESAYEDIWGVTDRDGRFRVDKLLVGHAYSLVGGPFPGFKIEPGKVKDLGDAKLQAP